MLAFGKHVCSWAGGLVLVIGLAHAGVSLGAGGDQCWSANEGDHCSNSSSGQTAQSRILLQSHISDSKADDESQYMSDLDVELKHSVLSKIDLNGKAGNLAFALIITLTNVSSYVTRNVYGMNNRNFKNSTNSYTENAPQDLKLLLDAVQGLLSELYKYGEGRDIKQVCPDNFGSIKRCMSIAFCAVEQDVPNTMSLAAITGLEELKVRFDTIEWEELVKAMGAAGMDMGQVTEDVPPEWSCEDFEHATLIQIETTGAQTQELATTLAVSAALEQATRSTEAILHRRSHLQPGSVGKAIEELEQSWQSVCVQLQCDHTNWLDIFHASHGHTMALITANASAKHLRAHVRDRALLEMKVQQFLGLHGDAFARQFYRTEDLQAASSLKLEKYGAHFRSGLWAVAERFLSTADQATRLRILGHVAQEDGEEAGEDDLVDTVTLAGRRRRRRDRRRRRRRFGKVLKKAGKAIAKVVKSIFGCVGFPAYVKSMGYTKKFPTPVSHWGVATTLSIKPGFDVMKLFRGQFPGYASLEAGVVVGTVSGIPTSGSYTGVGASVHVTCRPWSCDGNLKVGAVTTAYWKTSKPKRWEGCPFGHQLPGTHVPCVKQSGFTWTVTCCNVNLVTGSSNCR